MNPSQLSSHLGNDDLIGIVYGLGDADGHIAGCPECSERLSAMHAVRRAAIDPVEISGSRLAAQRLQILERLQQPDRRSWRWIPVAGAASVLAAAMVFYHQPGVNPGVVPQAPPAVSSEADTALFTDVYAMEQDVEPRAAAPIRSLFQEASLEKESQ